MNRSTPHRRRLGALAITAVLALAACGSDSDDADSGATTPEADTPTTDVDANPTTEPPSTEPIATEPSAPTFPSSITHSLGETTLEAAPERIATLDVQWTDVLMALGAPVVIASDDLMTGSPFPWQDMEGVELITPSTGAIPFEAIAAAQPDLIAASWVAADQSTYDQLSQIAPTIPLLGGSTVDAWEDMAIAAGELLGLQDEAADLIAESEEFVTGIAEELPGLQGKTYVLANYVPGDAIYVVADPDDGASRLFAQLGMSIDPDIVELDDADFGRVSLSLENIGDLDADLLMILTNGADVADIPGFDALPAVQSGAFAVLEYHEVVGLNTPTPLSIPYSLDFIRPALEAAAAI